MNILTTARPRQIALVLAGVAIPVAMFALSFHLEILDPTHVSWLLAGDWGAHAVGWNAFRHDGWRLPLGHSQLLAWPNGTTLTYTDSIPLISIPLKLFGPLIPEPFQFTGWWFLLCLVLQFFLSFRLIRRHCTSILICVAGAAAMSAVPTLFNRIGHASLFAHWTILLTLNLYVSAIRGPRRDLCYAGALVVAALVHPYLLLMSLAIWATDVVRQGWDLAKGREFAPLRGFLLRSLLVAATPFLVLWLIGGLRGDADTIGGFGYYSMSLDAPFNPGRPGVSQWVRPGRQGAGQDFEGFQYLGLGLLGLALTAASLVALWPPARKRLLGMAWLFWLVPALAVLTVFALSDSVQFHGRVLLHVPYGWIPFDLTDIFRASGRLFWPCTYVLVLTSILVICTLPGRWPALIFALAVALQAIELQPLLQVIRQKTAEAGQADAYTRTRAPLWSAMIRDAKRIELQPPNPHIDERLFYELAWRAGTAGKPVNTMYTARASRRQEQAEAAGHAAFLSGAVEDESLYVAPDHCPPVLGPQAAARELDGVVVIPPRRAGQSLPVVQPKPIGLDQEVATTSGSLEGQCILASGWSRPEPWGTWSDGSRAELRLLLPAAPSGPLTLTMRARGFPAKGQRVTVTAGGATVGVLSLVAEPTAYRVTVPATAARDRLLALTLQIATPSSPSAFGVSPDPRLLGIGIETIVVQPIS